jgi:hypothetical protein
MAAFALNYEDRFERLFETTPIAALTSRRGTTSSLPRARSTSPTALANCTAPSACRAEISTIAIAHRSVCASPTARVRACVEAFVQRNDLQLNGEDLQADVFGGRIRYAASTRLFASAFVQYLKASNELVTNLRFNFIHAPLSDIFFVVTERRALDGDVSQRVFTLKASRLLSF